MPEALSRPGRSIGRNALLNLGGQAVPVIVAAIALPATVAGLGVARFGVLSLAWGIVGYFGMFDFGLSRATTRVVASSMGRVDESRIAAILGTSLSLQICLGIMGGTALVLSAPMLAGDVLDLPIDVVPEATGMLHVLAVSIGPLLLSASFRGVLEALQRFDRVNAVRVPLSASTFLLPLVGVTLGWDLIDIAWLLVAAQFMGAITYQRMCTRAAPSLIGRPRFVASACRDLIGYGRWLAVSYFAAPILIYLDRFVLGALVPVFAVAYYVAPFEMVNRLLIIPSSLVAPLFPAFTALDKVSRHDIQVLAVRSLNYLLVGMGLVVGLVAANAHDILLIWLGPQFAASGAVVVQILCVGALINAGAQVHYTLLQAIGRPDLTAKFHVLELPVQLVLVVALVSWLGMVGAAIAWTLRVALDGALLVRASHRLGLVPLGTYRSAHMIRTTGGLCIFCLAAAAISSIYHAPASRVGISMALLGIAVGAIWTGLFDGSDRARFANLWFERPG